jgi:TRAP-type C4-dicarboxylate transport system substrate-binding protein
MSMTRPRLGGPRRCDLGEGTGLEPGAVGARPDAPRAFGVHHGGVAQGYGRPDLAAFLVAAGLVVAGVGCAGSHADKAGGSRPAKPVVLTLAAHDDDEAYATFVAAVGRLSHGSIRIRIAEGWGNTGDRRELDYERRLVGAVRAGKEELGIVGVRVWDTLGVDSFQALVSPFLIDSLDLERRAIESPEATPAMATIGRAGVVGIALLPGRLRRPLGITRPLIGVDDYRRAKIGARPSAVAWRTFRALGAHPASYVAGVLSGFDGAELDSLTISQNAYDEGARALTANVVLWPKPQTIVMNRRAYGSLTPAQRQILRDAGRESVEPELERIARDQRLGLSIVCAARLHVVSASPADLAALRKAVRRVYDQIRRDPLTRRWIARINQVKATQAAGPDVARCPSRSERKTG